MADIIIDGTTIASKSGSTVSLQNINSGSFTPVEGFVGGEDSTHAGGGGGGAGGSGVDA